MQNDKKTKLGAGIPMSRKRARKKIAAKPAAGQANPFISMEFESRNVKWGPGAARSINHCPYTFRAGPPIPSLPASYRSKPVILSNGKRVFAEIALLRLLQEAGWDGVWVDSWRTKYRNSIPPEFCALPTQAQEFLNRISGGKPWPEGCWDVFAWKDGRYLFVECKRKKEDSLTKPQKKWLESAVKLRIPKRSFIIFEWNLE